MHLAVSLVIRAEVQIARQMSQLHSIARATSSSAGASILAAAMFKISGLLPASATAAPGYKDRREKDAAREVSGPGRTPACGEITQTRPLLQPPQGHEHRMAGE